MKLSNEKIDYIVKNLVKDAVKALKKIDYAKPGDTLKINYNFKITICIDKQDVCQD